ncbi:hypothetical protein EYC80_000886 [Monilinia laxa]|uniref:Uncharacterized protein n=1 Tax=Monilinia laxa TaxID=61186 RepID=A0A5N6K8B7_MONLA|nr:hypothetical protein EYC80_000886 [Monilinia laxa]
MGVQKKEVVVEDMCCTATCNVYCEKCSIIVFKSNDSIQGPIDVAKKGSATNVEFGEEEGDDYLDPYDHTYYKNYSIIGFDPIRTPILVPTHLKLTETPTNKTLNMSRAKALSIAAAYVPSFCVQKKLRIDQKCSDIDRGIDTGARTIESLEWETLGIIGLRDASHDLEVKEEQYEGEIEVEKEQDKKDWIKLMEGYNGVVRSSVPVICLFMGLF